VSSSKYLASYYKDEIFCPASLYFFADASAIGIIIQFSPTVLYHSVFWVQRKPSFFMYKHAVFNVQRQPEVR
jgi:hypothetical protein